MERTLAAVLSMWMGGPRPSPSSCSISKSAVFPSTSSDSSSSSSSSSGTSGCGSSSVVLASSLRRPCFKEARLDALSNSWLAVLTACKSSETSRRSAHLVCKTRAAASKSCRESSRVSKASPNRALAALRARCVFGGSVGAFEAATAKEPDVNKVATSSGRRARSKRRTSATLPRHDSSSTTASHASCVGQRPPTRRNTLPGGALAAAVPTTRPLTQNFVAPSSATAAR
mmetsp:Transcript_107/g.275  ORF Transcript_107/g.275 Transcript_107/m.275 type:complete len:229 (+) Transcript_107:1083-1769(+)